MTPVRGIIFDKDGTLFDFRRTWEAWAEAFLMRAAGGDPVHAAHLGTAIGFDLEARRFEADSIAIAGTPDEIAHALGQDLPYPHAEIIELVNEEAARAPQAEAAPLRPLLSGLRGRGLKLGVATNDAIDPAVAHLARAEVLDLFDFLAGFDSGHGAKPLPGQLLAFCAETELAPDSVLMVGDSLHDLQAARAAGMRAVGVLTGLAPAEVLAPFADVVLGDIGHLPDWLDSAASARS